MKTINVAADFSAYPAGRFLDDGPFSGEAFREKHLLPALKDDEHVSINLDGGEGFGSSFLEEAFGGLVRKQYFSKDNLHKRLKIETEDNALRNEVWFYIDNAELEELQ